MSVRATAPRWVAPVLAVQFLTRCPVPSTAGLTAGEVQAGLVRAVAWFPLVGALVGAVTAAVALAGSTLWPTYVAVLLALAVEARLTGAFHEDAVADSCDALGGGRDAEDVRRIMKDSRIGSYGSVGLLLAIGLRAALTVSLLESLPAAAAAAAIVAASTFGRLVVVVAMAAIPPVVSGTGLAKDIGGGVVSGTVALALLTAVPGLALFALDTPWRLLAAVAAGALFLLWFRRLLLQRLGGSTGDCLGLGAYAGQLLLLLAVAAAR